MFEAYQEKRPKHVTDIDLSEKMAESLLHEEADIRNEEQEELWKIEC